MIKEAISATIKGANLSEADMINVMNEIMEGEASPAQIGAFLTALRIKGETVEEITGAAKVMREKALKINVPKTKVVDTCGTGGDESFTFNISTASAFVAAGAGITIAKHGNRSVSSKSGSADVLKALGVDIEAGVEKVEKCLSDIGIGFLFAPMLHGAMKYAIGPRREIGIRTIFNILGPLTNPAGAKCQVLGVYDRNLTELLGNVLSNLGTEHAFVVWGEDGLDEMTLTDSTRVTEVKGTSVKTYHIKPEDFGLERCRPEDLKGGDSKMNAEIILKVLKGEKGPQRDVVLLNAATAIVAGNASECINDGLGLAAESIDSSNALKKLNNLIELTN